jgi:hypothetical protein
MVLVLYFVVYRTQGRGKLEKMVCSVHWVLALTLWETWLPANNAVYSCFCVWLQCATEVITKGTGLILLWQSNSAKLLKYFTHISMPNARTQGDSWKICILYTSWYVSCLYILASYSNVFFPGGSNCVCKKWLPVKIRTSWEKRWEKRSTSSVTYLICCRNGPWIPHTLATLQIKCILCNCDT